MIFTVKKKFLKSREIFVSKLYKSEEITIYLTKEQELCIERSKPEIRTHSVPKFEAPAACFFRNGTFHKRQGALRAEIKWLLAHE